MNPYFEQATHWLDFHSAFLYRGEPEPSLPAKDAVWARQFVPAGE